MDKSCPTIHIHLLCFISNAVKKRPVEIFQKIEGVAQALLNFSAKISDPVAYMLGAKILNKMHYKEDLISKNSSYDKN